MVLYATAHLRLTAEQLSAFSVIIHSQVTCHAKLIPWDPGIKKETNKKKRATHWSLALGDFFKVIDCSSTLATCLADKKTGHEGNQMSARWIRWTYRPYYRNMCSASISIIFSRCKGESVHILIIYAELCPKYYRWLGILSVRKLLWPNAQDFV